MIIYVKFGCALHMCSCARLDMFQQFYICDSATHHCIRTLKFVNALVALYHKFENVYRNRLRVHLALV